jgi:hypothetical protein
VSLAKCHAGDAASDQTCETLVVVSREQKRNEHVSMGSKQPKKSDFHGVAPAGRGSVKIAGFETTSFTRLSQSETSSVRTAGGGAEEAILLDVRKEVIRWLWY